MSANHEGRMSSSGAATENSLPLLCVVRRGRQGSFVTATTMNGARLVTNLIHRRDRAKRIPTKTNKQKNQQILKASQSLGQAEPESTLPLDCEDHEPIMFAFALES